jgi:hypothetical protein
MDLSLHSPIRLNDVALNEVPGTTVPSEVITAQDLNFSRYVLKARKHVYRNKVYEYDSQNDKP